MAQFKKSHRFLNKLGNKPDHMVRKLHKPKGYKRIGMPWDWWYQSRSNKAILRRIEQDENGITFIIYPIVLSKSKDLAAVRRMHSLRTRRWISDTASLRITRTGSLYKKRRRCSQPVYRVDLPF